jgi:hypothetical protein
MANFAIKKRLFLGLLLFIHTRIFELMCTPFSAFWQVRRLLVCYRQVVIDDYFSVIFLSRFDWITQNEYFHFFFYSFQTFFPLVIQEKEEVLMVFLCVCNEKCSFPSHHVPLFFLNKKTAWLLRCPASSANPYRAINKRSVNGTNYQQQQLPPFLPLKKFSNNNPMGLTIARIDKDRHSSF